MNRVELIDAIIKDTGVEKKAVDAVLRSFIDNTEKAVKKGDTVTIVGFGTFSLKKRAARKGRNPQTGETVKIAAKKVPAFKAGKAFKDVVNGAKKEVKEAPAKKAPKAEKTAKKGKK
ncbi:MAG: HU family DNA-binding protein [Lachnospiraceae bacterium]|nr:HU family DNA-binding protein [Lachnospiraceae bacterium]